jgi:membrane protein YdbS with pleckstrin-like domain
VTLGTVLLVVFVVLKLTGNVDWSWWWVLSPLWIGWGLVALVLAPLWVAIWIDRRRRRRFWGSE